MTRFVVLKRWMELFFEMNFEMRNEKYKEKEEIKFII